MVTMTKDNKKILKKQSVTKFNLGSQEISRIQSRGFLGHPAVKSLPSAQEVWAKFLVGEPRSYMPHGQETKP